VVLNVGQSKSGKNEVVYHHKNLQCSGKKKQRPKKTHFIKDVVFLGCCIFYPKVEYHLFYHIYSKQPPQMLYFIHPKKPPPEWEVNF
jgi:hypothetical protein